MSDPTARLQSVAEFCRVACICYLGKELTDIPKALANFTRVDLYGAVVPAR